VQRAAVCRRALLVGDDRLVDRRERVAQARGSSE